MRPETAWLFKPNKASRTSPRPAWRPCGRCWPCSMSGSAKGLMRSAAGSASATSICSWNRVVLAAWQHGLSYLSRQLVHGRFLLLCPHNHNQSFHRHRLVPGIFDLVPSSPIRASAVGSMLPRDSRHGVAALYTGAQPWPSEFRACPPQLSSTGCLILPDSLSVPRVIYHYL